MKQVTTKALDAGRVKASIATEFTMSIKGIWTQAELESIAKDKWVATVFMNRQNFSEKEIGYYPYNQRRVYLAYWIDDNPNGEPIELYATDERNLLRFIDDQYTRRPDNLFQIITQYRPIKSL
jgi:hypothetical protein